MSDMKKLLILAGVALSLTGCQGIRERSGYVEMRELTSAIEPGIDNKDSVARTLGRPTFIGQFADNDWYYVYQNTSQFAFRRPSLTDASVLHIEFDPAGNVVAVDQTGKELAAKIDPDGAKTPTLGREKSFFEEIFGNIGSVGQTGMLGGQQQ